MSQQAAQSRTCPTCGNSVPSVARYCPSCGTRLDPATAYSADDFESALADVLNAPEDDASFSQPPAQPPTYDAPTSPIPPISVPPPAQTEWTASASDWFQPVGPPDAGEPGTWGPQPPLATAPAPSRGNRTLWMILAIFGFIVFCCCGGFAVLMVIGSSDTGFQEQVSRYALLRIG